MNSQKKRISGIIGIDAGGSFTDIVFVPDSKSADIKYTKTPTDRSNMLATICQGLDELLIELSDAEVREVHIATTFATNAIVEQKICKVGVILLGYDKESMQEIKKANSLETKQVISLAGGHDEKGNERVPLDIPELNKNLPKLLDDVEAIAVSGYFSVRNPQHEIIVKNIIKSLRPDVLVTCGHEVASNLDAISRATTTILNAGLIPIINKLMDSVQTVFWQRNLLVPLYIVKSDGTLINLNWAKQHPIETILSGPAASALGGYYLADGKKLECSACIIDIGGTTTDIILLDENGLPAYNLDGAVVGKYHTLIKTVDIFTFGLGGDSRIKLNPKDGSIIVGPRRVSPLCYAATKDKTLKDTLQKIPRLPMVNEPLIIEKGEKANSALADQFEGKVLQKIQTNHLPVNLILEDERFPAVSFQRLDRMEVNGLITFCGFTPTDVLHVQGRLHKWDTGISEIGACFFTGSQTQISGFCDKVFRKIVCDIALNVLRKNFKRVGVKVERNGETEKLILANWQNKYADIKIKTKLKSIIVGVGAPAWAFIDEVAALLETTSILPAYAEVAGAIGAAICNFQMLYIVHIRRTDGGFRAHLPFMVKNFKALDEAIVCCKSLMQEWLTDKALKAGAVIPSVSCQRHDANVNIGGRGTEKTYLWTDLHFSVVDSGRKLRHL